jgi:anti-sigma regulatory factor (Ser/Thr protein kinase)
VAYRASAGMRAGYRPNRRPVRRRQALMSGTGAYGSSYAARSDAAALVPPAPPHPGQGIAGEWPLRTFLELGALPGAVPCARLHARQVVWEWGLAGLGDDVEILVSELVTNAVAASRSLDQVLPVRVWLLSDKARVLVVVWDASPRPPARVEADDDAESGRGLLLVEAISERWGWYPAQETGGKATWAVTAATP